MSLRNSPAGIKGAFPCVFFKSRTPRDFMKKLLVADTFDTFLLWEASVTTFCTFHIDGTYIRIFSMRMRNLLFPILRILGKSPSPFLVSHKREKYSSELSCYFPPGPSQCGNASEAVGNPYGGSGYRRAVSESEL